MKNLREVSRNPRVHVINSPGFEPTLDGDEQGGAFLVNVGTTIVKVIASNTEGWDHVSVSTDHRIPTWEEMDRVKRIFFRDDEYAFQLHLPPKNHINCHPYCLHIWRCQTQEVPLPHPIMVGPH